VPGRRVSRPRHSPGIGRGWLDLVDRLNIDLARERPPSRVTCLVDHTGLPTLVLDGEDAVRRAGTLRRAVATMGAELLQTCERCGGRGRIHAGVVLVVLCDGCAGAHP
jgi:hypothetical protein